MSPPNAAKYCGNPILSVRPCWSCCCCLLLCSDNIVKLFLDESYSLSLSLSISVLSKEVLKHPACQLGEEGLPYLLPISEVLRVCFEASTNPLPPSTLPSLTAISDFTKIKSCMQSCSESHQCQVDRRHKERLQDSDAQKPVRKSRLFWQEETRQSAASSLRLSGEKSATENPCDLVSVRAKNSGVNSEESAMAGCYDIAGRQKIFSGNKKKEAEEDQRAGDDRRAKHFLWPIPSQMTVKFIPPLW